MDIKLISKKAYENIISGIISVFSPIIIINLYKYITKIPLKTIYNLPFYIYLLLFLPLSFWIIRIIIKAKMEEGVHHYIPNYIIKYKDCGYLVYKGIYWIIQIPEEYYYESIPFVKNHLNVSKEPRCNKCGTKLEFTKHDLWYTWKCVNCNFIERTFIAPDRLRSRVKKKYERLLEIKDNENKRIRDIINYINTNFKTSYGNHEIELLQKLKYDLMQNRDLLNEIRKQNKDEIKPLFQKYYHKRLKNKTSFNKNFYNDIDSNFELKNFLEEFLIDAIYKELEYMNLIKKN